MKDLLNILVSNGCSSLFVYYSAVTSMTGCINQRDKTAPVVRVSWCCACVAFDHTATAPPPSSMIIDDIFLNTTTCVARTSILGVRGWAAQRHTGALHQERRPWGACVLLVSSTTAGRSCSSSSLAPVASSSLVLVALSLVTSPHEAARRSSYGFS